MSLRCGTAFENPVTRAVACRYNAPVLEVVPGMTIKSSGEGVAQASGPVLSDYVVLLKPRVTALVVFTAGMIVAPDEAHRSEEHTSELQSLMRIAYAVFCLKKK